MLALACTLLLASTDGYDPDSDAPKIDLTVSITAMSRRELLREYRRVEEARPGIGGPIAAMSIGGGISAVGLLGLALAAGGFGGLGAAFSDRNPSGYFFATITAVGSLLLMSGFWVLWNRRDDRALLGDRLDAINERLDELERVDPPGRERLYREPPRRERSEPVPQL